MACDSPLLTGALGAAAGALGSALLTGALGSALLTGALGAALLTGALGALGD